jgi:hypothetical protein
LRAAGLTARGGAELPESGCGATRLNVAAAELGAGVRGAARGGRRRAVLPDSLATAPELLGKTVEPPAGRRSGSLCTGSFRPDAGSQGRRVRIWRAALFFECLAQALKERHLRGVDPGPCFGEREPLRAVDLGELAHEARARRPLEREPVAAHARRAEVAFRAQAVTSLPPGCLVVPSSPSVPAGSGVPSSSSNSRGAHGPRILALLVLGLRDRPRSKILLLPEGSAGVSEQHLGRPGPHSVQQDARALLRHSARKLPARGSCLVGPRVGGPEGIGTSPAPQGSYAANHGSPLDAGSQLRGRLAQRRCRASGR